MNDWEDVLNLLAGEEAEKKAALESKALKAKEEKEKQEAEKKAALSKILSLREEIYEKTQEAQLIADRLNLVFDIQGPDGTCFTYNGKKKAIVSEEDEWEASDDDDEDLNEGWSSSSDYC